MSVVVFKRRRGHQCGVQRSDFFFFFPSTEGQQTIYSRLFVASDSWIWVHRPAGQTGKLTGSLWSGKQGVESLGMAVEWGRAADKVGRSHDASSAL